VANREIRGKKEKKKRKKKSRGPLEGKHTVIYITMKRAALYLTVQSICCSKIKGVDPDSVKDNGSVHGCSDSGDGAGGSGGHRGAADRTDDSTGSDSS